MDSYKDQFKNECIFAKPNKNASYKEHSWSASTGWTKLMKWVLLTKENPIIEEKIKELVVTHPKEINKQNSDGYTALMIAVLNLNTLSTPTTINTLLRAGAKVDIQNIYGKTILMMVFANEYQGSMKESKKYIISPDHYNDKNRDQFIKSFANNVMQSSYLILDTSITEEDVQKMVPNSKWKLIKCGSGKEKLNLAYDFSSKNLWINTNSIVLNGVSLTDKISCQIVMNEQNNVTISIVKTDLTYEEVMTPLDDMIDTRAVKWHEQYDVVEQLLTYYKSDLNVMDTSGNTALIYAMQTGNNHHIKLLLDGGADPKFKGMHSSGMVKSFSALETFIGRPVDEDDITILKQLLGYDTCVEIDNFDEYIANKLKEKLDNQK